MSAATVLCLAVLTIIHYSLSCKTTTIENNINIFRMELKDPLFIYLFIWADCGHFLSVALIS